MYRVAIISSLEKVLPNDNFDKFQHVNRLKGLRGERVAFQIVIGYELQEGVPAWRKYAVYKLESDFEDSINLFFEKNVPVLTAAYRNESDDDYISKEAGMYPDALIPLKENEKFNWEIYTPTVLMAVLEIPEDATEGIHNVKFEFTLPETNEIYSAEIEIDVYPLKIKKSDLMYTQWFHSDCIADYHGVDMMSEEHWELIEKYVAMAAHTGINMILTPIFTPALDTAVGTERPTMQLVNIENIGGKYKFDFTLLERWVKMCRKYGIKNFEMAHLFTQWGAAFCPKIMVKTGETVRNEFGWAVRSNDEKYRDFLSQFLPALTAELKHIGIDKNTYFHISDEPSSDIESAGYRGYEQGRKFVEPYLKDFKIMDALSHIDYYKSGLVTYPVCSTNHIEPFLRENIEERWCYYCCSQGYKVSNRFIAMPSYRNRILGVQLFLFDIKGFLHWGYNFYNAAVSTKKINPYITTDGEMAFPAGDPFSVYPYNDSVTESIRTVVFYQGLQDRMLLKMLADKIGENEAKAFVKSKADITFKEYPRNKEFLENLHDEVLELLIK